MSAAMFEVDPSFSGDSEGVRMILSGTAVERLASALAGGCCRSGVDGLIIGGEAIDPGVAAGAGEPALASVASCAECGTVWTALAGGGDGACEVRPERDVEVAASKTRPTRKKGEFIGLLLDRGTSWCRPLMHEDSLMSI